MLRNIIVAILLVILLVSACAVLTFDSIAKWYINNRTDVNIEYAAWGTPFDRRDIKDLVISLEGRDGSIKAGEVELDVISIDPGRFEIKVTMKEVVVIPGKQMGDKGLVALFTGPSRPYDVMEFTFSDDGRTTRISKVKAKGPDVKVYGDYVFNKASENMEISMDISLSPGAAALLPEEAKKIGLTPDKNGWYGTIVNFKGNPVLLKALYMISE